MKIMRSKELNEDFEVEAELSMLIPQTISGQDQDSSDEEISCLSDSSFESEFSHIFISEISQQN